VNDMSESAPGLCRAALEGDLDLMRSLIESGEPVNVQDQSGDTPLHLAVMRGDEKKVDLLLRAGADPTLCNHNGESALSLAESLQAAEACARRIHRQLLRVAQKKEMEKLLSETPER